MGKKKNQVWVWLALDALTRQVVAVHAGGCSEQDTKAFWAEVPELYRFGCDVYTDDWEAYRAAIPEEVHFAVKKPRKTSLIEGVVPNQTNSFINSACILSRTKAWSEKQACTSWF